MKKLLTKVIKNQNGNAFVIVAILMTFFFGMAAIAIDAGRLYLEKSRLQKALDAAVLAGAQELIKSEAEAVTKAKEYAIKNSFTVDDGYSTTSTSIKATKTVTVPMTFAKIIGINQMDVSAAAKAIIAPLKLSSGLAPIAVEKASIPDGTFLNCADEKKESGNCYYLSLDGTGGNVLKDTIINGSNKTIEVDTVEKVNSEPGEKWGKVKEAFETLINNDAKKSHCQNAETADSTCDRIIYVAVIESWEGAKGRAEVEIIGLAAYWVSGIDNSTKAIRGIFIDMVKSGEVGGGGPSFGLNGVKLVE